MTGQAHRTAKEVDPQSRDMAEALARRAGMSLEEWLEAVSAGERANLTGFTAASAHPSRGGRMTAPAHPADDLGRITAALERLSEKLDASETRAALAVSGVDKLVREALERVESGEREQTAVAARFEGAVHDVSIEQVRLNERLSRIESEARGPKSAEALRALEAALGKVAGQLYRGETNIRETIEAIAVRLEAVEAAKFDPSAIGEATLAIQQIEHRLESLAAEISKRDELAREAEQRSTAAVERIGREMLDVNASLVRRVQTAEARGAEAIEQVGGEVARIADAMEAKLGRVDTIQAQALDKLGAEIERITERMAERIASSDRRASQAIDDVGDQVARITERLGQRQDRAVDDLSDRIRQSEERTAALLKEARETIELLATGEAEVAPVDVAAPERDPETAAMVGEDPFNVFLAPAPPAGSTSGAAPETMAEDVFPAFQLDAQTDSVLPYEEEEEPSPEPVIPTIHADALSEAADDDAPDFSDPPAAQEAVVGGPTASFAADSEIFGSSAFSRAETSSEGRTSSLFGGSMFGAARQRGGARTAALGLGMAAAFGLAIGGFMVVENEPHGPLTTRVAGMFAAPQTTAAKPNPQTEFSTRPAQEAAVALAPRPMIAARPLSGEAAGLYASAVAKVEASDPKGAVDMRRAADLGYAPAEFYLARLYETGGDGIAKDSAQARHWTQKAALAGDPRAMHNLGLYEFQGKGGPANAADAVQWFHRAAELGLEDSQYNLARLYEEGLGVPQNTAEAYKWYLIAARNGDPQAKAGAARTRAGLSAAARTVAEQAAAQFRSVGGPQATATAQSSTSSPVATAQKALLALGYYQGPTDGIASPALGLAISAYQRDQGLPTTGATDPATMGKLAALAR